jgi:Xaa-Pro aminopeptidase
MATRVFAGVPAINKTLYHRVRFSAFDPVAIVEDNAGRTLIVRDVELPRARAHGRSNEVLCPADLAPNSGLSGDREIATAQALVELLRRRAIRSISVDRSLPMLFAQLVRDAGVEVVLDVTLGVSDRRSKDAAEVAALRQAQHDTEQVIARAAKLILEARARADGVLMHEGTPLTSDRVRSIIDIELLRRGYDNPTSIIACGPIGADCHHAGEGELRTGQPCMIDVFPRSKTTLYNGDCTRTVVHGIVPPMVRRMFDAVIEAKRAAEGATRAGSTGDAVHRATIDVLTRHGVRVGQVEADAPPDQLFIPHGTGHGIGLDLKEPPLLDIKGVELVEGDCVTIEPAVYALGVGGVRIEDMYIVRTGRADNLNELPELIDPAR